MEQPISQLIEELNRKMDLIITSQNIILKQLQISTVEKSSDFILIRPPEKYKKNGVNYMLRLMMLNDKSIQQHFNLKRRPSSKRLIYFLTTLNPKAFDGLKRKQEHQ